MLRMSNLILRPTIICGYKFYRILEIVHLVGTHFKLAIFNYSLFENVEKFNIRSRVQFLVKIGQIANFAKFTTRKQKCP